MKPKHSKHLREKTILSPSQVHLDPPLNQGGVFSVLTDWISRLEDEWGRPTRHLWPLWRRSKLLRGETVDHCWGKLHLEFTQRHVGCSRVHQKKLLCSNRDRNGAFWPSDTHHLSSITLLIPEQRDRASVTWWRIILKLFYRKKAISNCKIFFCCTKTKSTQ